MANGQRLTARNAEQTDGQDTNGTGQTTLRAAPIKA